MLALARSVVRAPLATALAKRPIQTKLSTNLNNVFRPRNAFHQSAVRRSAAEAGEAVEGYGTGAKWMHWIVGGGVLGCVGFVQAAQWTEDKQLKGKYMMIHKSFGVLTAAAIPVRLLIRLASKVPDHLPGPKWQQLGGTLAHYGIAMGYFGGRGLPLFGLATIPGAATPQGDVAKNAFKAGQALEYFLIPAHVGAVGVHMMQGHRILARMNPFVKAA